MFDFQKPIQPYLNEKQNIIRLILFTSLFALVFINAYSPFGVDRWVQCYQFDVFNIFQSHYSYRSPRGSNKPDSDVSSK